MSRTVKTEEGKRAEEAAKKVIGKCRELGRVGDLKSASRLLHESIREHFNTKRFNGQAGEVPFRSAAHYLLEQCVILHVPPPERLLRVFELLLGIEPGGLGDRAARIAFAAQYQSMKDVPVAGLTRAHVITDEYTFESGETKPVKTKLKRPIGHPIDRKTARTLKANPEFRELVEEAKARGTVENRQKQKNVTTRAKQQADRFAALRKVVEKAAQASIVGRKKPRNYSDKN